MDYIEINEKFGSFENYVNIILVVENARSAFLLQPIDYNEVNNNDKITQKILIQTKQMFPELFFYFDNQGIIICKNSNLLESLYTPDFITNFSSEEMGKILDYPCYKDINEVRNKKDDELYCIIDIFVHFLPNEKVNIINLFTNVCLEKNKNDYLIQFYLISEKFKNILNEKRKKYNIPEVKNVEVRVSKIYNTQIIIDNLINKNTLTEDEKTEIENILFNFGFSLETQLLFSLYFQYENPIHTGILLGLLLNSKNYLLDPFIPIYNYPEQKKELSVIINNWEKNLITTLLATSNQR
jgi:hypothetical protein